VDAVQFKQVVAAVVQRAADLIAAGLAALLTKAGAPEKGGVFGIAVDGSVYHKYPKFRSRLHIALTSAVQPIGGVLETSAVTMTEMQSGVEGPGTERFRAKFVDVQNGSCFGTAVVAATAGGHAPCGSGESDQNLRVSDAREMGSIDREGDLEGGENVLEGTDQVLGDSSSSDTGALRQRRGVKGAAGEVNAQASDVEV
jgi:hypothetical protein